MAFFTNRSAHIGVNMRLDYWESPKCLPACLVRKTLLTIARSLS